jgi:hypothetical protein
MSIKASCYLERAERVRIGRRGTLRDRQKFASDVEIDNLSTTGCSLRADYTLPVGSLVSIGIPGIGMHAARITRSDSGEHGCAFLLPINTDDVDLARSVDTVASGNFPQMIEKIRGAEAVRYARRATDRLPAAPDDPKPRKGLGRLSGLLSKPKSK